MNDQVEEVVEVEDDMHYIKMIVQVEIIHQVIMIKIVEQNQKHDQVQLPELEKQILEVLWLVQLLHDLQVLVLKKK